MSGSAEPAALITSPSFKLTADKLTNPLEAGVACPELVEGASVGVAETTGLTVGVGVGVGVVAVVVVVVVVPPPPPPPLPPETPQAFALGVIITVFVVLGVIINSDLSLKHSYTKPPSLVNNFLSDDRSVNVWPEIISIVMVVAVVIIEFTTEPSTIVIFPTSSATVVSPVEVAVVALVWFTPTNSSPAIKTITSNGRGRLVFNNFIWWLNYFYFCCML